MKRFLFLIVSLLLLASQASAAITFDAASSSEGTTSTTHNATIAADANIAIVCVALRENNAGNPQQSTGVTVGGAAATLLVASNSGASNPGRIELWYKLAPSTGTVSVVATGDATTDEMVTGVLTFKGVAQTSTFNTATSALSSAGSANMDVDSIASALGEMGVLCGYGRTSTTTASADATSPVSTERYEDNQGATGGLVGVGYTEDGAASTINMRVDLSASVQWAAAAVSMKPLVSRAGKGSVPILLQ
jgi:hypothetical protein